MGKNFDFTTKGFSIKNLPTKLDSETLLLAKERYQELPN